MTIDPPEPCVVLVAPTLAENVGAAARVMGNFGLSDLRLVGERDFRRDETAGRVASHSVEVLRQARVFPSLPAAISRSRFVVGSTARTRDKLTALVNLPNLRRHLPEGGSGVALVFGRESSGLTNRELSCCDLSVQIPACGAHRSFNLSQAVALVLYEWRRNPGTERENGPNPTDLATSGELEGLKEHWFDTLQAIGFLKPAQDDSLRQQFSDLAARVRLRPADVSLLRGLLHRTQLSLARSRERARTGPAKEA